MMIKIGIIRSRLKLQSQADLFEQVEEQKPDEAVQEIQRRENEELHALMKQGIGLGISGESSNLLNSLSVFLTGMPLIER
jgi:tartrate dehydratase alpha subunit/fumarate hydratase class I-like protein